MTFNTKLRVAVVNWAWQGIKAYCCAWFYSFCCGGPGEASMEHSSMSLNQEAGGQSIR
jgi:hypothetical protein